MVSSADGALRVLKEIDSDLELKYNKFYIGMAKYSKPFNFVLFCPKICYLRVEPELQKSDEIKEMLGSAELDVLKYDSRNQRYRIRLSQGDIGDHEPLLKEVLERVYRRI